MRAPLTEAQADVLRFIENRFEAGTSAPTCREICDRFGFRSPRAATDHLKVLEKKGYIARDAKQARGIRLLGSSSGVPLLGEIPAGMPVDPALDGPARFKFDLKSLGIGVGKGVFALTVRGDSMEGRQIYDGDVALIDGNAEPQNHSVVAALIDNEVTLKTFILRKGKSWLRAENLLYPDLIPAWDLRIQGVAYAVIRLLRK